ncbi:phytanoyl- dioxygenase family [Trichoderma arundinaceum]|uniref:Phytanoyl-dioxygenase family n=1 Tax=Trichoderma arundinaceum TaxID=490622 RepID=A0A395NWT3_TRIAR|nr:phytanoyl- dioxygenase family [Trichoderma arundinaceum]
MAIQKSTTEQPRIIKLTDEELATTSMGSHNLQAALEALHEDGLVVLENAVNPAHLDHLNKRMIADAEKLKVLQQAHVNFNTETQNFQQEPVPEEGYIFDDVIANPWAAEILEHMLGPKPKVRFYSANTAFKAEARQPVHIDMSRGYSRTPFGFCVNINLVSTSPENGATEFWLGTHNVTALEALTINGHGDDGPDPVIANKKKGSASRAAWGTHWFCR